MKHVAFVLTVAASLVLTACSGTADPSPQPSPSNDPASQAAGVSADGGPGSGTHSGGMDARDAGRSQEAGAFGALCMTGSDCASNVCFSGGKGGVCSLTCAGDTDCPLGWDDAGPHCNPRGYCQY